LDAVLVPHWNWISRVVDLKMKLWEPKQFLRVSRDEWYSRAKLESMKQSVEPESRNVVMFLMLSELVVRDSQTP